ncbi:MAG: ArsR family transcriptional regulator [Siphonobacter aquaeclarae]|nr:ArsR family transcriptional regulator [Siphonobacter aquaeclarae]
MNKREFKDRVYGELAAVTKAMANPHRLEIIDLLAQGPFSVEQIAGYTGLSVANASQHLQTLRKARLVSVVRNGNFILYSLSDDDVFRTWVSLRELGTAFHAEIEKLVKNFREGTKAIDAQTMVSMLEKDEVILIDVRPEEEYRRGHIHRALSMPVDRLPGELSNLPRDRQIVAYCRGPFCAYADEAVRLLLENDYQAVRLEEGYREWVLAGYPAQTA